MAGDSPSRREHRHRDRDSERDREHRHRRASPHRTRRGGDREPAADSGRGSDVEGQHMPEPLAALGHMAAHPSEQQLPGPPSASASSQQAAADAAGTDPATLNAQVQDSGGEVSMSIQETNRVRISLGLKPLSTENNADRERKEHEAQRRKQEAAQKERDTAELADRVKRARDKRQLNETYQRTQKLGDPDDEVDDVAAWVTRSRITAEEAKTAARAKAAAEARRRQELEEEEDEEAQTAHLAGMQVRHKGNELHEGETMILTLADRNILDEGGDLDEAADELENVLAAEHKGRDKARRAAQKAKPLFEEDGKKRGVLDKYDEEEAEEAMQIDATGNVEAKQEEIRKRLQLAGKDSKPSLAAAQDYYTSTEMAQFQQPKKKRKKKMRSKVADEDALDLAALEAEAAAADSSRDRGSREERAAARDAAEREGLAAADEQRKARYEAALQKANEAAAALRPGVKRDPEPKEEVIGDDDDDEDLQEVLSRARRAAAIKREVKKEEGNDAGASGGGWTAGGSEDDSLASWAAQLTARHEADANEQAKADEAAGNPALTDLDFTEASEFARSIQLQEAEEPQGTGRAAHKGRERPSMEDDDEAAPTPAAPKRRKKVGNWVTQMQDGEPVEMELDAAPEPRAAKEAEQEEEEDTSVIRETQIGKGLGGVLSLLKERGELEEKVHWAGRANDKKKVALIGLDEVYQGGDHADQVANRVEMALTRRDEYGRVLTPKQAFREVAYRFHGIYPSKKSKEKIMRQVANEMAAKKNSGSVMADNTMMKHKLSKQGKPSNHVVVKGSKAMADPLSGYDTVHSDAAPTPVLGHLGGGDTPLVGNKKVEAMLGVKRSRQGASSMPPPPARAPKSSH